MGWGRPASRSAVGADVLDLYPGGVWWVELAQLAEQSGVGRAALAALSSRAGPGAQVVDQLAFALGDQPSLLVLDNCEHLIAACAELVTDLLSANPSTSVLTTSREPAERARRDHLAGPVDAMPEHRRQRRRPGAVAV